MKRWLIRQILIPWLRERGLVLPAQKRNELAKRLGLDELEVATIEQLIQNAIIEALLKE
jgi:hypothetical protein